MKEAGTGESAGLHPFKQFGKEIRNGEQISKDQRPYDYSLNAYLNPSYPFFCLVDPENMASVHLMLPNDPLNGLYNFVPGPNLKSVFEVILNNLQKGKSTYND
jgi:hypothetical protein